MDIEGAELDALRGARPVIVRDRPVLTICVYHVPGDLWRLPLLMKEMIPEYQMFLRTHEGDGWQTVAYGIPPGRVVPGLSL
jgi:methyltransferase FkbM-like protein